MGGASNIICSFLRSIFTAFTIAPDFPSYRPSVMNRLVCCPSAASWPHMAKPSLILLIQIDCWSDSQCEGWSASSRGTQRDSRCGIVSSGLLKCWIPSFEWAHMAEKEARGQTKGEGGSQLALPLNKLSNDSFNCWRGEIPAAVEENVLWGGCCRRLLSPHGGQRVDDSMDETTGDIGYSFSKPMGNTGGRMSNPALGWSDPVSRRGARAGQQRGRFSQISVQLMLFAARLINDITTWMKYFTNTAG